MEKNKVPYVSKGSYVGLIKALESGVYADLDRIVFHTIVSGEEHLGDLCLVFPEDKSIHWIDNSDLRTVVQALSGNVTDITDKINSLGEVEINGESTTITQYVNNTIENNTKIAWEEF